MDGRRFPSTLCSLCTQDVESKRSGRAEPLITCNDCGASGTPSVISENV